MFSYKNMFFNQRVYDEEETKDEEVKSDETNSQEKVCASLYN